jgi:hypothetical protein
MKKSIKRDPQNVINWMTLVFINEKIKALPKHAIPTIQTMSGMRKGR